jgi:hypothetical protein
MDTIVSDFGDDFDFETKIRDLISSSHDIREIEKGFSSIGVEIGTHLTNYSDSVELANKVLDLKKD